MKRRILVYIIVAAITAVTTITCSGSDDDNSDQMELLQYLLTNTGAIQKPCAYISKSEDVYNVYIQKADICVYPLNTLEAFQQAQDLIDEYIIIYGSYASCVDMQVVMQENKDLIATNISSKYSSNGIAVSLDDAISEVTVALENGLGSTFSSHSFTENQIKGAYLLNVSQAKIAAAYYYAAEYGQVSCQTAIASLDENLLFMPDVSTAANGSGSKPAFAEVQCQYGDGANTNALCATLSDEF